VNLYRALAGREVPLCFPEPAPPGRDLLTARDLYEITLPLRGTEHVVGNDLDADAKPLTVITGANQGGKSTLARAVALAALTSAAGLPAPAAALSLSTPAAVFTHYRRAEDATMSHGKFEEELTRMREIVEHAVPGSLVVLNESFAATNEREGAEVAVPIIHALLDAGLRVVLVTHSYELADQLRRHDAARAVFLRAQRLADGTRPFRLAVAAPQTTSYGQDLYDEVFAERDRQPDTPPQAP
jgi:DNA mismatch repair ATPase MutS